MSKRKHTAHIEFAEFDAWAEKAYRDDRIALQAMPEVFDIFRRQYRHMKKLERDLNYYRKRCEELEAERQLEREHPLMVAVPMYPQPTHGLSLDYPA